MPSRNAGSMTTTAECGARVEPHGQSPWHLYDRPDGATSRPPESFCSTMPPTAEGRGAMAGLIAARGVRAARPCADDEWVERVDSGPTVALAARHGRHSWRAGVAGASRTSGSSQFFGECFERGGGQDASHEHPVEHIRWRTGDVQRPGGGSVTAHGLHPFPGGKARAELRHL